MRWAANLGALFHLKHKKNNSFFFNNEKVEKFKYGLAVFKNSFFVVNEERVFYLRTDSCL